jgi:hypothetical protein
VLFALAIWLARGRRRQALRAAGWSFVVVGLLLLLVRRVGGNEIVDSLVKVPSNEPAVHQAWVIATSLLFAIAVALTVYGVVFALAAWLGGPTRSARFLRKAAAPELRESPGVAYAAAGGLLLALVIWGPTPAFRQLAWILVFAALLALGVTVLRRQTAVEFPGVQRGDAWREQRERREAARARKSAAGAPAASPAAPAAPAPSQAIDHLERLAALHDSGQLSDTEFATAKTRIERLFDTACAARCRPSSRVGRRADMWPQPSRCLQGKGDKKEIAARSAGPSLRSSTRRKRPRSPAAKPSSPLPCTTRGRREVRGMSQEVRVDVAPQNRKSRSHAGFRPSKWRDPDSNRDAGVQVAGDAGVTALSRRGRETLISSPPVGRAVASTVPPCTVAIDETRVRPSPKPSWPIRSSSRVNGRNRRSTMCAGTTAPVLTTRRTDVASRAVVEISTVPPAML